MLDTLGDGAPRIMATSQKEFDAKRNGRRACFAKILYYRFWVGVTLKCSVPLRERSGTDIPAVRPRIFWRARKRDGDVEFGAWNRCSRVDSRLIKWMAWQCAASWKNAIRRLGLLRAAEDESRARGLKWCFGSPACDGPLFAGAWQ